MSAIGSSLPSASTPAPTTGTTTNTNTPGTASSVASTIQATGIGSGLDIASIVSQLTTSEGYAQTTQLTARQTALQSQFTAYQTLGAALEALQATLTPLQTAKQFEGRTATLADTKIASATADSTAIPGQYSLQVANLATSANLVSTPIPSADSTLGTGTLTISVGGVAVPVIIDGSNNTLTGIAAAINSAVGNPGVSASVIKTNDGARLVLTGTKTGTANSITVAQSGGDGGLAPLTYDPASTSTTQMTLAQAAKDAQFTINGYAASSASNQVTGVISGVTLNLTQASAADTPTTLTVGYDQDAAASAVTNFVTAYNALITTVQTLTSYDATTGTAGTLLGNTTVNSLVAKLRQLLSHSVSGGTGGVQSLTDLGITTNVQGTLDLDAGKLSTALSSNIDSVASLLGGTTGIATQVNNLVSQYTQSGGLLDTINQGLQSGLSDVSDQQKDLQLRLATYSASLTAQFNAMDAAVAALKQTQNYLTQAFAAIDNANNSSSSSSG